MASTKPQFTSTERIEYFSDAVIAIIITIMVLEFRLPEHALDKGLWLGAIKPIAPKVLSYLLSFLVLTTMWVSHHALMHSTRFATPTLMWCNNNVLFWMSLTPFTTMLLGDNSVNAPVVALYGGSLAATATSFALLRRLIMKENPFRGTALRIHETAQRRTFAAIAIYLAAIPLAFVSVYISLALYAAAPAMFFFWHMELTKRLFGQRRL